MWEECCGVRVSDSGVVMMNGKELKQYETNGYKQVKIADKLVYVHRLVAKAFIANPDEKPFINHKDGNKSNNSADNLEWVTAKENCVHALTAGLYEKYRCISCGKEYIGNGMRHNGLCSKCYIKRGFRSKRKEMMYEKLKSDCLSLLEMVNEHELSNNHFLICKSIANGESISQTAKKLSLSRTLVNYYLKKTTKIMEVQRYV